MPVYYVNYRDDLAAMATPIIVASLGVVAGTIFGKRVLTRIPDRWFRRLLAIILGLLGIAMLARGLA